MNERSPLNRSLTIRPGRTHAGWWARLRMTALLATLILAVPGLLLPASSLAGDPHDPHPREKTLMKRRWGVEVVFVRQTAGGYMLEFRYKVLDAAKAASLFDRQTKPLLKHDETGATFIVPTPAKTGALRNSNPPKDDHVYWMFFANPGKYVKVGDTVTIEIGDFRAEHIEVQ